MEQTCFRYSVQPQTEHIKDYTHTIAVMIEDMVDYADRNGLDRNEVVSEMLHDMNAMSGYCDMNKYRPLPE